MQLTPPSLSIVLYAATPAGEEGPRRARLNGKLPGPAQPVGRYGQRYFAFHAAGTSTLIALGPPTAV
eukprot:scaffold129725_cov66-Phaeocystis_antarctica.AAC.1